MTKETLSFYHRLIQPQSLIILPHPLSFRFFMSIYAYPSTRPSLDPSRYSLQDDERQFFQLLTGIQGDQQLKEHILAVQERAYQVCLQKSTTGRYLRTTV